jgi:hypothetical protein
VRWGARGRLRRLFAEVHYLDWTGENGSLDSHRVALPNACPAPALTNPERYRTLKRALKAAALAVAREQVACAAAALAAEVCRPAWTRPGALPLPRASLTMPAQPAAARAAASSGDVGVHPQASGGHQVVLHNELYCLMMDELRDALAGLATQGMATLQHGAPIATSPQQPTGCEGVSDSSYAGPTRAPAQVSGSSGGEMGGCQLAALAADCEEEGDGGRAHSLHQQRAALAAGWRERSEVWEWLGLRLRARAGR